MLNIKDKVVCIDSSMLPDTVEELIRDVPNWVEEGKEYTIRGFADHDFVVGVYLEEIHNPPKWFNLVGGFVEPAFKLSRFRKIENKQEEISINKEELMII